MQYLVILLTCLSIASCASTTQKSLTKHETETKTVTNTSSSTTAESQYEALNLLDQLELFKYVQNYRNKCVNPSVFSYLALERLKEVASDKDTSLSSDDLRNVMKGAIEKVKASRGNYQIERPLTFISSPDTLTSLEKTSNQCFDQSLNYFNELSEKYIAIAEGQEFPSGTSMFSDYFEAKSNFLVRSYALETNEYRAHPETTTLALDGYTEFMFRVYRFIAASNQLLKGSGLTNEKREKLINSVRELKESRDKIGKDFDLYEGLQMVFTLANYKKGDPVNSSDAFKEHESALNESIDTFYPLIDQMKVQVESLSPDAVKVVQLMIHLDSLLTLHERRVSKLRLEVTKTQINMIMQAAK